MIHMKRIIVGILSFIICGGLLLGVVFLTYKFTIIALSLFALGALYQIGKDILEAFDKI